MMNAGTVMPIGIIDESNDGGGIMTITRPHLRKFLTCETPIVIWNQDDRYGACVKMAGFLTEISGTTAAFRITAIEQDPGWPEHIDPKGSGNPVYLGSGHGFMPDMSLTASPEEMEMLYEFADQHEEQTGIKPTVGIVHQVAAIDNGPDELGPRE